MAGRSRDNVAGTARIGHKTREVNLHRISVKYFLAQPENLDLGAMIPVFHGWIQQTRVPGMLVDVADYRHMWQGPGVVLIGHDVDYALDLGEGRIGLLHVRKRMRDGELAAGLGIVFHSALVACRALEQEARIGDSVRVATDEVKLVLADRLRAPNRDSTFERIRGEIDSFLEVLYAGASIWTERDAEDERRCLTMRISATPAPDLDVLIDRAAQQMRTRSATQP